MIYCKSLSVLNCLSYSLKHSVIYCKPLSVLNCNFIKKQSMLPENDRTIESWRFKCFNINFRLLKTKYVHFLMC